MSLFEISDRVRGAWPTGARDFDFLILGGLGNVDQCRIAEMPRSRC